VAGAVVFERRCLVCPHLTEQVQGEPVPSPVGAEVLVVRLGRPTGPNRIGDPVIAALVMEVALAEGSASEGVSDPVWAGAAVTAGALAFHAEGPGPRRGLGPRH
jgi:hypothetical protein